MAECIADVIFVAVVCLGVIPHCTACLRNHVFEATTTGFKHHDRNTSSDRTNIVLTPGKERGWSVSIVRPGLPIKENYVDPTESLQRTKKEIVSVDIETNKPIAIVDKKFLSIAIDSNIIKERWKTFDFQSERLRTLSKAVSPCYLRVGGTEEDYLFFNQSVYLEGPKHKNFTNFTMTVSDWDGINQFARDVGWSLIFGLNVLLRHEDNTWDASNAKDLLDYTIKQKYKVDWELGNEPNSFNRTAGKPLDASLLAEDFISLRQILDSKEELRHSLLVGPDTTEPKPKTSRKLEVHAGKYMDKFLKSAGNVTNATTWHQYYVDGRTATLDNFTDYHILETLIPQIQEMTEIVDQHRPGSDIWLGETSSAFGGGAPKLSNTYAAGFMWLDKLGISAIHGLKVVIRQSFYNGHYALIDEDLNPYPDYWLTVLYKRLVGFQVLALQTAGGRVNLSHEKADPNVRVYAHCANRAVYPAGSVTMYAMSLHKDDTTEIKLSGELSGLSVDEYLLTSHGEKGLRSQSVNLNGEKLKMTQNNTLPELNPRHLLPSDTINLPPYSFGFYVVSDAMATACL